MRAIFVAAMLLLTACGAVSSKADGGPDTSCGFDCAAQTRYGLLVNRCFEYSSDALNKHDPPALGAWVRPLRTLEGGVQVLPVEYRVGGLLKMTDDFAISNGNLLLMRREFAGQGSVTYKTGSAITGVKWLAFGSGPGENYNTTADAFVIGTAGAGTSTPTTFTMTTAVAAASELRTPMLTFDAGVKLLPGESPDHGSDTRRVWVPDVGFVMLASSFLPQAGQSLPYVVQRIRDPGTPDGGSEDCSLGRP